MISIVNLAQPRIPWEESLPSGLSKLGWTVGMWKIISMKLLGVGSCSPLWVAPFLRQRVLNCVRWRKRAIHQQASRKGHTHFSLLSTLWMWPNQVVVVLLSSHLVGCDLEFWDNIRLSLRSRFHWVCFNHSNSSEARSDPLVYSFTGISTFCLVMEADITICFKFYIFKRMYNSNPSILNKATTIIKFKKLNIFLTKLIFW